MFNEILNEQQTLELVLEYLSGGQYRDETFAGQALVYYIMKNFPDLQTEEEIANKYTSLIVDHNIQKLHAKNLIEIEVDENGDEVYSLTEEGKNCDLFHE